MWKTKLNFILANTELKMLPIITQKYSQSSNEKLYLITDYIAPSLTIRETTEERQELYM